MQTSSQTVSLQRKQMSSVCFNTWQLFCMQNIIKNTPLNPYDNLSPAILHPPTMEKLVNKASQAFDLLLKPASWVRKAVDAEAEAITSSLRPRASGSGGGSLMKRVGYGVLGAAYACMVLTALLVVAVAVGVGTVRMWVEEPVVVREDLQFDYTQFRPEASFSFGEGVGKKRFKGVPVGHTYYVSVVLLLPESDYNRHVGVFQLTAEVLSKNGVLMTRSSHPCMIRYRSWAIRMARTFLMGVPILLGTTLEAQKLTVDLLTYRETGKSSPRTGSVRVTLSPRAGTALLPELYESQILVRSRLPWVKQLVRSWKWTFYVWASLYSYIMLLTLVLFCFRPLVFPGVARAAMEGVTGARREVEERRRAVEEMDAGTLRRWQQFRRKRKAEVLGRLQPEEDSSVTSFTVRREEEGGRSWSGWDEDEEEVADSSSVNK